MGSKVKFWTVNEQGHEWLFKKARANTGEHWAEKVACELAGLLGIEHALVELASYEDQNGCISRNLLLERRNVSLVHGNEILEFRVEGYEKTKKWNQSMHTYTNIIEAIEDTCKNDCDELRTRFAGYMLFDAWIGNMDRHHENWALLRTETDDGPTYDLCPSYDHGSSLGRELTDQARMNLLEGNRLDSYIFPLSKKRGRGAIYWLETDERPLRPIELVGKIHQDVLLPWTERLSEITSSQIESVLEKVPETCMVGLEKRFVAEFLALTQSHLCNRL